MDTLDIVVILAWLFSVGTFLNSIVQPALRLNSSLFYLTLIVPLLYPLLSRSLDGSDLPSRAFVGTALDFLSAICAFYDVGFVADILIRAETDKPPSFTQVAGQFLLIWFFVIGVWSIQPKINRLYGEQLRRSPSLRPPLIA